MNCPVRRSICLAVLGLATAAQAQPVGQFLLRVPGQPNLDSRAEVTRSGLRITDAQGGAFDYLRNREADSRDGQYLGFYCRDARRHLRWPAAGRGRMYLSEGDGAGIVWRESQMQVVPATTVAPIMPSGSRETGLPRADLLVPAPMHLAVLERAGGEVVSAFVDAEGRLQCYVGREDRWQQGDLGSADGLRPGIPLVLIDDPSSGRPEVFFVDGRGDLCRFAGGRQVDRVGDARLPQLSPYAHLYPGASSDGRLLYTVDSLGRLWLLDLDRGRHTIIDRRDRAIPPGAPLAVVSGAPPSVAAIDSFGRLVRYVAGSQDVWREPEVIAAGLAPGGYISYAGVSNATGAGNVYFASVDALGATRLFTEQRGRWLTERANEIRLPPGAPLDLAMTARGLALSAVGMDGQWRYWQRQSGQWLPELIADGFLGNSPVVCLPARNYGFAVDRRGQLIAARRHGGRWRCHLCSPQYAFAPQLVSRRIVPNPPLAPAAIQLVNQHNEPLVVKISDRRIPGPPVERKIEAGRSATFQADRDAGATLEEVYLAPGPLGTLVEQVHQFPLPPQPLYDVVVYADRVTSVYFDRTQNQSDVPDSIAKSEVSLGVFPLPPGELLQPDSQIDVYGQATYQRNPGAAAWFGPP